MSSYKEFNIVEPLLVRMMSMTEIFPSMKIYVDYGFFYLKDSKYHVYYELDRNISFIAWYNKFGTNVNFSEVFEKVDLELKQELIYYMDDLTF